MQQLFPLHRLTCNALKSALPTRDWPARACRRTLAQKPEPLLF